MARVEVMRRQKIPMDRKTLERNQYSLQLSNERRRHQQTLSISWPCTKPPQGVWERSDSKNYKAF